MAIDRTELDRWLRDRGYALVTREQAARMERGPGVVPWEDHRRALAKADAELGELRVRIAQLEGEFEPGRWWRVTYAGGVWCETSDERQAREALTACPSAGPLQRLYSRTQSQWRDVP